MSPWTILLIFLIITILDKGITVINIHQVQKNFPETDALSIEKNPLAKKSFENFGLLWGSIVYGLVSIITMILFFLLLRWSFNEYIALYSFFIIYGIVIVNNLFFLLKYSKII